MRRLLVIATLASGFAAGCGSSTSGTMVDGAPVGADGWPVRPAQEALRCPEGTFIVDETVGERRRVTCRTRLNPAPRGFELAWHPNGRLATRRIFDERGRPSSVKSYDTSGRLVAREDWEDGVRLTSTAWYPNGEKRTEEVFVVDSGAVEITRWAPDGSVEARGTMVDGARQGTWTEWVDGAQERAEYSAGVRAGEVTRTYADGSVETGEYAAGERDGTWRRLDPSGSPLKVAHYDAGVLDGQWRTWHPNRQPKAEGGYLRGDKHGEWVYWRPSGEVAARETFKCGTPHGLVRRFHPNGQPKLEGVFWDGRKVGEWRHWNASNDLTKVDEYAVPESIDDLEGLRSGARKVTIPRECPANAAGSDPLNHKEIRPGD